MREQIAFKLAAIFIFHKGIRDNNKNYNWERNSNKSDMINNNGKDDELYDLLRNELCKSYKIICHNYLPFMNNFTNSYRSHVARLSATRCVINIYTKLMSLLSLYSTYWKPFNFDKNATVKYASVNVPNAGRRKN